MDDRVIRIGGASAYFADTQIAVPQLLADAKLDYLVFDYLGEGAMAIFGRMLAEDPESGFPPQFLSVHVGPFLREIVSRGIKVVANAGAMNPAGLARAVRTFAKDAGIAVNVVALEGDNALAMMDEIRASGVRGMFMGEAVPEQVISANIYLGALPIAEALDQGADIVVTGRVVDSAVVLGPLIHEFGWSPHDYDAMAAGTLAGHLLECGAQVTGGTFTDWEDVPDWANIGFPIGECSADGTIVVTKAPDTGGLVSVGTVAEQLLYEVSDPQAYFVPDVTCDFSQVKIEQVGENRVRVSGAIGYPPTDSYKLCVTYSDGWRAVTMTPIVGFNAAAKAERTSAALVKRIEGVLRQSNMGPFKQTSFELIGQEASFGAQARTRDSREIVLKMTADHDDPAALAIYAREHSSACSSMSTGTSINQLTSVVPLTRLSSYLVPKTMTEARLVYADRTVPFPVPTDGGFDPAMIERPVVTDEASGAVSAESADETVELIDLAFARSGEKGELFNTAVIARDPAYLPWIRAAMSEAAVKDWYEHAFVDGKGTVTRYEVPGSHALNFLVDEGLIGGINAATRLDPAGKTMGQQLLFFPIPVPGAIAARARAAREARSERGRRLEMA